MAEKPELENEFKDKVMKKVATFISFFNTEFYTKNSKERKLLTAYVGCFIKTERENPMNLKGPNAPRSDEIDEATKFNIKASKILNSEEKSEVKLITLSDYVDHLHESFLRIELPKFKSCLKDEVADLKTKTDLDLYSRNSKKLFLRWNYQDLMMKNKIRIL